MRSLSSQHLARASHTHRFPSGEFIHNTPTRKRSHQAQDIHTSHTSHSLHSNAREHATRTALTDTDQSATPRVHAHVHVCLVASLGSLSGSLDGLSGSAIASFGVPSFGHLSSLSVLASLSGSALFGVDWFGRFLCTFDGLCRSCSLSFFVHFLVARAIHPRVDSPPCRVR